MADIEIILYVLFATFATSLGEYCTQRYGSISLDLYCPYGCCGYDYSEYCCVSNIGVIIGITVGCLAFVAVMIGLIVMYCARSRRARAAAARTNAVTRQTAGVVQYQPGYPGVTTVSTSATGVQNQTAYSQWAYDNPASRYATDFNKSPVYAPPPYPGTEGNSASQPSQPPPYSNP